jgi:hypothetical protein
MAVASASAASGGAYIAVPNGSGCNGGKATLTFSVPAAGSYAIWGRILGPTTSDDSLHASLDVDQIVTVNDGSPTTEWRFPTAAQSAWTWDRISRRVLVGGVWTGEDVTFQLGAGAHTLYLNCREDGAAVDRVFVTGDLSLTP